MSRGKTAASVGDLAPLVHDAFGDGKTVGQHRAVAIFFVAFAFTDGPRDFRARGMAVAEPMIIKMSREQLGPETSMIWLWTVMEISTWLDPCRYPQLALDMMQLRLADSSESELALESRIRTVSMFVAALGWRFPNPRSVADEILANVAVGAAANSDADRRMGWLLGNLFKTRFCPSFASGEAFWEAHPPPESAPLGLSQYQRPGPDMAAMATALLGRVARQRLESAPHDGDMASDDFVHAAWVALCWLGQTLVLAAAPVLVAFCLGHDNLLFAALFGVLDMKRHVDADTLRDSARFVLRALAELPLHTGEQYEAMRAAICRAAQPDATTRSRRLAIDMMHRLYLRRLFTSRPDEQRAALRTVLGWVGDAQAEVRKVAAAALKHMLRVTPPSVTEHLIVDMVHESSRKIDEWIGITPAPGDRAQARLKWRSLSCGVLATVAAVSAFTTMVECKDWMLKALFVLSEAAERATNVPEAKEAIWIFKLQSPPRWKAVWKASHCPPSSGGPPALTGQ